MVFLNKSRATEYLVGAIPVVCLFPAIKNIQAGRKTLAMLNTRIQQQSPKIFTQSDMLEEHEANWKIIRGVCEIFALPGLVVYSIMGIFSACCFSEAEGSRSTEDSNENEFRESQTLLPGDGVQPQTSEAKGSEPANIIEKVRTKEVVTESLPSIAPTNSEALKKPTLLQQLGVEEPICMKFIPPPGDEVERISKLIENPKIDEKKKNEIRDIVALSRDIYKIFKNAIATDPCIKSMFNDEEHSFSLYHHEKEIPAILESKGLEQSKFITGTITVSRWSGCLTHGSNNPLGYTLETTQREQEKREKTLLEAGTIFLQNSPKVCISIANEMRNDDPCTLMLNLLKNHEGICLGESHDDPYPKVLLMDNMQALKEAGVNKIYLEHLFYDSMQPLLDKYFEQDSDKMPSYLGKYLGYLYRGAYVGLVMSAQRAKIRLVALDTTISYTAGTTDKMGCEDLQLRCAAMNSVAAAIIQFEQNKDSGKYIALMGSAHVGTMRKVKGIPGVAEVLNVPSLVILGANTKSARSVSKYDAKNVLGKIEFASAVIE